MEIYGCISGPECVGRNGGEKSVNHTLNALHLHRYTVRYKKKKKKKVWGARYIIFFNQYKYLKISWSSNKIKNKNILIFYIWNLVITKAEMQVWPVCKQTTSNQGLQKCTIT